MDVKYLAALCRKATGSQVSILRAAGLSYTEIEEELRLKSNNGMTAWRLEGNKHKPPVSYLKYMAQTFEKALAKEQAQVQAEKGEGNVTDKEGT